MSDRVELSTEPICVEDIVAGLTEPRVGAVAAFVGVVRAESEGQPVRRLEYEAYRPMAHEALERIVQEVKERFPTILHMALVHRVGTLAVGETAVVVAVAAAHRHAVYAALAHAVDRLKEAVPIWKKEIRDDGAVWRENP